jgi:hypothetical protein
MIANFMQYGLSGRYGDVIACDFSLSPWRTELRQEFNMHHKNTFD